MTFAFADRCAFDLVHFHIATPLPKTDLYRLAKTAGVLPADFDFRDPKYLGYAQAFIATDEFTPFELMVLRAFEWDRINLHSERTAKAARMMNMTLGLAEHRYRPAASSASTSRNRADRSSDRSRAQARQHDGPSPNPPGLPRPPGAGPVNRCGGGGGGRSAADCGGRRGCCGS
jgi:hypothetical protein